MQANLPLSPRAEQSWHRGLGPLFRKEMRHWWSGRRWLILTLLWLLMVPGLLAMILFVVAPLTASQGDSTLTEDLLLSGLQGFFAIGVMTAAIGVIVLGQDAVIGEKLSGSAAWLLSKPVTRPAFLVAKLAANTAGATVAFVLVPALGSYLLLTLVGEPDLGAFTAGTAIVALHTFFYLVFTLLLGVIFDSRGPVLGIALAFLLGGNLLGIGPLAFIMPWGLGQLALAVASGIPLPGMALIPLLLTVLWSGLCLGLALWQFDRQEL